MIYKWTISAFDCAVKKDKLENVISTVHWRYSATDANSVSAETYGATALEEPKTKSFIKFDKLTEEQVCNWLESILDVDAMQAQLNEQILLKINPITVTLPPLFYSDDTRTSNSDISAGS